MAERARLEIECAPKAYRGFESPSLRGGNLIRTGVKFPPFFVPKACKIEALRKFNRLPPLRDKTVQHSVKKHQISQKSPYPVGQVVNFYQQLTALKIPYFSVFLRDVYQNFVCLIKAGFRDMLIFILSHEWEFHVFSLNYYLQSKR